MKKKQSVVTIGTFDGVHKAHTLILQKVVLTARKYGLESVVVSFKQPVKKIKGLITTEKEKIDIISSYGIDKILLLPVDEEILSMSAEDFFENVLKKEFNVRHIVVGYDCTFGKNKEGNISWLTQKTKKEKIKLTVIKPVKINNKIISSSQIRKFIDKNDIVSANKMLDRFFEFSGCHITGNKIGRTIGLPTVNIKPEESKLLPCGVFGCYIMDENNKIFNGLLNIGIRPTIRLKEHLLSVEVHILNFSSVWKSKRVKVLITDFIRKEKKFKSLDCLKKTIKKDVDKLKFSLDRHKIFHI